VVGHDVPIAVVADQRKVVESPERVGHSALRLERCLAVQAPALRVGRVRLVLDPSPRFAASADYMATDNGRRALAMLTQDEDRRSFGSRLPGTIHAGAKYLN
jgi:hypothetical protein